MSAIASMLVIFLGLTPLASLAQQQNASVIQPVDQSSAVSANTFFDSQYALEIPLTRESLQIISERAEVFQDRYLYIKYGEDETSAGVIQLGFFETVAQLSGPIADGQYSIPNQRIVAVSADEANEVLSFSADGWMGRAGR